MNNEEALTLGVGDRVKLTTPALGRTLHGSVSRATGLMEWMDWDYYPPRARRTGWLGIRWDPGESIYPDEEGQENLWYLNESPHHLLQFLSLDDPAKLPELELCCGRYIEGLSSMMGTTLYCMRCRYGASGETAAEAYDNWNNLMLVEKPWTKSDWFKQWLELARLTT